MAQKNSNERKLDIMEINFKNNINAVVACKQYYDKFLEQRQEYCNLLMVVSKIKKQV